VPTPKQIMLLVGFVLVGALVLWLGRDDSKVTNASDSGKPTTLPQSEIHQIALPHDDPEFPAAPGRQIFLSRCTVCHTLRYVTMQPDFPKKVWAKEVAKMINTYGAHISGEEARQITDYLAAVKGSEGASK